MESIFINPGKEQWAEIIKRPAFNYASLENIVFPILQDVKENGDVAIKKYTAHFDKAELEDLKVSQSEIDVAASQLDDNLKKAILLAKENVYIASERLRLGVTTYVELIITQKSLEDAYTRLIAARYDSKVAETELLRLKGDLVR